MGLEVSEDLVALAYQSLGYFVIQGLRFGRREVDLVGIQLGSEGTLKDRFHAEVQISVSPIGVLRGPKMAIGEANADPVRAAKDWFKHKFPSPDPDLERVLGGGGYRRILVHGKMVRGKEQREALDGIGVECVRIGDLIGDVSDAGKPGKAPNRIGPFERVVGIAKLLIASGDVMSSPGGST